MKNTKLELFEGESVFLEEYTREMICEEEAHVSEIEKMLRAQPKK